MATPIKLGKYEVVGLEKVKDDSFAITISQKVFFKFSGEDRTLCCEEVERVRDLLTDNKVIGTIFLPQEEKIL